MRGLYRESRTAMMARVENAKAVAAFDMNKATLTGFAVNLESERNAQALRSF
jgi:hypothetical protein